MSRHPALAVPVTLWGGPLDGLVIRLNPAAQRVTLSDLCGRSAVYIQHPAGRWGYDLDGRPRRVVAPRDPTSANSLIAALSSDSLTSISSTYRTGPHESKWLLACVA